MSENKEMGWNFGNTYIHLPETFYAHVKPTPVRSPQLILFNERLAESLGLNSQMTQSNNAVEIFAGNHLPPNASPLAQAYEGHQFGHFTMLGDGRAILLGEQITPQQERYDIQLKGSGRTPYSRGGDGRATLGSMIREYIISEAMHGLGIPTTRSLAVVTTGEDVFRETALPGAVLTRVSASHLRVGTFEYAAKWGEKNELQQIADYTIERHFPHLKETENKYLSLLKEVIHQQAKLIAKWQLVGFIHGVMNTDNMAISGETIDYGPCAFMDQYAPDTVFSSIDRQGRYAYKNQPVIGGWNLARFAEALLPLLDQNEEKALKMAQDAVSKFPSLYHTAWLAGMRKKFGLFNEEDEDEFLIKSFLQLMQENNADFTNTFVALTVGDDFISENSIDLFHTDECKTWTKKWEERLDRQQLSKQEIHQRMKQHNPAVIPRNHRVEEAIEAAVEKEDHKVMENLLRSLSKPYAYLPEQKEYTKLPPATNCRYQTYCGT